MQTYKIVKGDSIYSIAKKFSIREDVLKYNNPDLNKTLKIGQELKIYNGDYIEYKIGKGDTILAIANKFGVKVTDILRINSLQTSEIKPGNIIILKNPDLESYNDKIAQAKIDSGKLSKLPRNIGGGSIGKSQGGFAIRWPVRWAGINSGFGRRLHPVLKRYIYHQGVDTPVKYESAYAAADGVVSTAGTMSGYGLIIIIKHSNGYETRYAHLSKMSVRPGQKVKMGDYIGKTGATGRVTGPHLHFEVRKNGKALNKFYIESIVENSLVDMNEIRLKIVEDIEIARKNLKEKNESEKQAKKFEEKKKLINETYLNYMYDLKYDGKKFVDDMYKLLNNEEDKEENIMWMISFNTFTFYIKDFFIKLDKDREEEFKKFYIEKSKIFIKNGYQSMQRYFFEEADFLNQDIRKELEEYYNKLNQNDFKDTKTNQIDILKIIKSIYKDRRTYNRVYRCNGSCNEIFCYKRGYFKYK